MWKGKPDVRKALFGGRGTVKVWALGAGPEPFTALLGCELSPRGSVGPHAQEDCGEVVAVLAGRGAASVDGVVHPLAPGAVVELPLGSVLTLENTSRVNKLRYLIIKARAG
ncbi:MAG: cupin domain-containing protein [Myxococcaceae bacterium]|nr:cupin domain-containing protein [Myxococcaceae bacterium]